MEECKVDVKDVQVVMKAWLSVRNESMESVPTAEREMSGTIPTQETESLVTGQTMVWVLQLRLNLTALLHMLGLSG